MIPPRDQDVAAPSVQEWQDLRHGQTGRMEWKIGAVVQVREFGGRVVKRRVVGDAGRLVYVCSDGEYEAASAQSREPEAIGFPRECITGEASSG